MHVSKCVGTRYLSQSNCVACSENGTCCEKYALNGLSTMTRHVAYKFGHPLVLYIHGFREDQTKDTVEMVVTSYIARNEYNLVLLDWSYTAADLYPVVVPNVQPVSVNIQTNSNTNCIRNDHVSARRNGRKVFLRGIRQ